MFDAIQFNIVTRTSFECRANIPVGTGKCVGLFLFQKSIVKLLVFNRAGTRILN